jgi:hypothetical protein
MHICILHINIQRVEQRHLLEYYYLLSMSIPQIKILLWYMWNTVVEHLTLR